MISAIILAAGESKRMGQPKMLLPWGDTTVLGKVIETFKDAGIEDILVVTGGATAKVTSIAARHGVHSAYNESYSGGDMLSSVQCGLRALSLQTHAALIALGDQPQVEVGSVLLIADEYMRTESSLIVPSYQLRRGHPWLIARELWNEILQMKAPDSLRDFLNRHAHEIHYIELNTPTILQDLDTPEDYLKSHP
jgi:molybdenum cofactor cytidylyltransferase